MRRPLRLLALPAGAALTALIVCGAAVPAGSGAGAGSGAVPVASTSPGVCGGAGAAAIAAARQRGVAYEFLAGRSFSRKASGVGSRAVVLGSSTYDLRDFTSGKDRVDSGRVPSVSAGLVGKGVNETVLALQPDSSTSRSRIPTTEYLINPLNVLRVSSAHAVVGGFTLQGSEQGHTYNGLRVERSTGPIVSDVKVDAIPGDMDRPPGETFGINDYRTTGARYSHIDVDGADVGAAGFASNASTDVTVCDAYSHDNAISMGFAFWSVRNVKLVDCVATDNGFAGFNFERVSGHVTLIRPVARDNRWDMRVVSDQGSATYTIIDPDLSKTLEPGKWTVEVPSTYWQHEGKQKLSDIHLIVDGEERPDLLHIVVPY